MIMRYKCNICGAFSHEERCKTCGEDSDMEKVQVPYCKYCKMPVWGTDSDGRCDICGNYIEEYYGDIIPVFLEEKVLLSVIYDKEIYKQPVWSLGSNRYLIDNKKKRLNINKIKDTKEISKKYYDLIETLDLETLINKENEFIERFIKANKERFLELEIEGHEYVVDVFNANKNRIAFVSFSGGKDSIVVSDIVRQALSKNNILHIFGNTTLEMKNTIEFIDEFKKENPSIPFIEVKSDKDFMKLCEEIGPPTRIRGWCCSIFKSGPISQILNTITYEDNGIKHDKFLTFYGVRAEESSARNKYGRTSNSPKITSQKVVSPVYGWLDYDIWLYILTRRLKYNYAYRLGYRRVGCWCCPNNSKWSEFLNNIYYENLQLQWTEFLYNFAQKIGKKDYKEYVDGGYWKARHGGAGLNNDHTKIDKTPCVDKKYENFIIQKSYSDCFDEYLKPFGSIKKSVKNEMVDILVYDGKSNKKLFEIETRYDSKIIKFMPYVTKNVTLLKQRFECQLRKYQLCIKCSACDSVCSRGAISTFNNIYKIDSNKCIHCLKCIAKFNGGCLMNEVLIKKEE